LCFRRAFGIVPAVGNDLCSTRQGGFMEQPVRKTPLFLGDRQTFRCCALLSFLIPCAAYGYTLSFPLAVDDYAFVSFTNRDLPGFLFGRFDVGLLHGAAAPYYRPLVSATFWALSLIADDRAMIFANHLLNLLVHAGATLAVFMLAHRLAGQPTTALLASALAGLSPIGIVPVCWSSARSDSLGALFLILSVLAWRRAGKRATALACALLFAGTLCKEFVLLAPLLLIAADALAGGGLRRARAYLPPAAVAIGAAAMRPALFGVHLGGAAKWLAMAAAGPRMLASFFAPSFAFPWLAGSAVALAILLALLFRRRPLDVDEQRELAGLLGIGLFGGVWVVVTMAGMSDLVRGTTPMWGPTHGMALRYWYVSGAGIALIAAAALAVGRFLYGKIDRGALRVLAGALLAAIYVFIGAGIWKAHTAADFEALAYWSNESVARARLDQQTLCPTEYEPDNFRPADRGLRLLKDRYPACYEQWRAGRNR